MEVTSHRIPPDWYVICPCCERMIPIAEAGIFKPDPPSRTPRTLREIAARNPMPEGPKYDRTAYLDAKPFLDLLHGYRYRLTHQQLSTLRGQALAGDLDGARKGLKNILSRLKGG